MKLNLILVGLLGMVLGGYFFFYFTEDIKVIVLGAILGVIGLISFITGFVAEDEVKQ